MAEKEGLDSAVDSTKLLITLASGLIAFVTGTTFLAHISTGIEHWAVFASLALLAASLLGGVFVLLEAGSKYSQKDYDLTSGWIQVPGIVNLFGFFLGAAAVAVLASFELLFKAPVPPAPGPEWHVHCTTQPKTSALDCSGTSPISVSPSKD